MKIICFGDSNTFGYDPRAYFGGRYDPDCRWVDILGQKAGHEMLNYGQNGRAIPCYEDELELYKSIFQKENADFFIVMLGNNDILMGLSLKAIKVRMERLIRYLPFEKTRILLVAPPYFAYGDWVEGEAQIEMSRQLSAQYRTLAEAQGLHFADAQDFGVQLSHDGVHFTARGHRAFAEGIYEIMEKLKEK